jgi:hypothetical protein
MSPPGESTDAQEPKEFFDLGSSSNMIQQRYPELKY